MFFWARLFIFVHFILDFYLFLIDSKKLIWLDNSPEFTIHVVSIFLWFLASVFTLLISFEEQQFYYFNVVEFIRPVKKSC